MKTKIIEAVEKTKFNWGKFLVGKFTDEWDVPSHVNEEGKRCLLSKRGWGNNHALVLDLETGEGAVFCIGGLAKCDLEKHRIWVCPLFEPFLEWLYQQDLDDLDQLPSVIDLGYVPTAIRGYRRPG